MRTFLKVLILFTASASILKYFVSKAGFGRKKQSQPFGVSQISPANFLALHTVFGPKNWATLLGGFKNMQFWGYSIVFLQIGQLWNAVKTQVFFLGIIPK